MQTQQCVVSTNLILPFGFFKTITTKIKASIRLGAGGKISQVKRKKKKERERALTLIELLFSFPGFNLEFLDLDLHTGSKNC